MTSDDRFGQVDRQWQPDYRALPDDARADARRPRPVRRRRWGTKLAIVVLALAALFTAADRITVGVAESEVAKTIQTSQNLDSKPSVSIDGFPFLTQVLGMDLHSVSLDARGIERNGVRVTDLRANAHGVRLGGGFKPKTIDSLDGTAFFNWADLDQAAAPLVSAYGIKNLVLSQGPGGTLKISGTVLGVGGTAEGQISIGSGNQIRVRTTKLGAGFLSIPDFHFTYAIGALPLNIKLTDFRVDEDGIRVSASATDVPVNNSGLRS